MKKKKGYGERRIGKGGRREGKWEKGNGGEQRRSVGREESNILITVLSAGILLKQMWSRNGWVQQILLKTDMV